MKEGKEDNSICSINNGDVGDGTGDGGDATCNSSINFIKDGSKINKNKLNNTTTSTAINMADLIGEGFNSCNKVNILECL